MAQAFKLPDLGEGIHEGEVVSVLVSVGDTVQEGQPILEIETDKAEVEIPSPYTGTVEEILVKPDETVKVGSVLMVFGNGEQGGRNHGDTESTERKPTAGPITEARPHAGAPSHGAAPVSLHEARETRSGGSDRSDKSDTSDRADRPSAPTSLHPQGPVPASPATRRLARELGVDLHLVPGTGRAGLVTAQDVRGYAAAGTPTNGLHAPGNGSVEAPEAPGAPAAQPSPAQVLGIAVPPLPDFGRWGCVERVTMRSVRRATARHMALAWSQIPHASHQDVADITRLEEFRRQHALEIEAAGGRLTLTVLMLKAAVAALKAFPRVNASLDAATEELILKRYYHLSVAVDTERGLVVPVLRDVDRKSITELAIELRALAERTRAGGATLEEMQGGTFTITNLGLMGGTGFVPIVNYPQVAILGMGRARLQPVVLGDEGEYRIVPRLMLPLGLGFDHRVLDGADAARFLRTIIESLEDPEMLWLRI